jgi:D-galactarolactone cycloisomerase
MSRIRDIRLIPLEYRLVRSPAYGMARSLTDRRTAGLVLLETDDGIEGIGETWGPPGPTRAYLDLLKPYFVGTSLFAQRGVALRILAKHYHFGSQNQIVALLSGIDIAAFDAIGKRVGLPVCDLIGGRQRAHGPVYASDGYFTDEADQDSALERQLQPFANQGFPGFKIKIGRLPAEDARRVALARRIIGPKPLLMVDANGNYTADVVLESMRRIADHDIHWYEEPLAPQDWGGLQDLKLRAPIPVATGEALYELFDFRRVIDQRLASVVQPDLCLCGGLDVARTIGALCASEHLRFSPHVWGTGIGLAAAAHFVAALPAYPHTDNVPYPSLVEYDIGENALRDEIFENPLVVRGGYIEVPEGPGLGVKLNRKAVERLTAA